MTVNSCASISINNSRNGQGEDMKKNSYVEPFMAEEMNKLRLRPVFKASGWSAYMLEGKGTGIYRTLITFNPEGIVLQGDIQLGQDASGNICSCLGYGEYWFSENLSEGYLCQKFLRRVFLPQEAEEYLRSLRDELDREGRHLKFDLYEEVLSAIHDKHVTQDAGLFGEWWNTHLDYPQEDTGYAYDPVQAGWLCAIQQRFHVLYKRLPEMKIWELEEAVQSCHDISGNAWSLCRLGDQEKHWLTFSDSWESDSGSRGIFEYERAVDIARNYGKTGVFLQQESVCG